MITQAINKANTIFTSREHYWNIPRSEVAALMVSHYARAWNFTYLRMWYRKYKGCNMTDVLSMVIIWFIIIWGIMRPRRTYIDYEEPALD